MKICLVTPAPARSRKGNRVTALRWARLLRELGHRVTVAQRYEGQRCDLLVALHAGRSADSIARFRANHPARPLVVALTGTDLYGDIHTSPDARASLELASRLVLLQPLGVDELPEHLRHKARVIYQSVPTPAFRARRRTDLFEVCVLGHLRPVKDPFRTARAARLLPPVSQVRVLHLGAALSANMAEQALAEQAANPRYRWLGERPRWQALRTLARCRLLSLTSELEGGANVISEALAVSVPVVASRIAGSVGLLGDDYPGYFPFGDTEALAALLRRAETDAPFYRELAARCRRQRALFRPARERRAWARLLKELGPKVRSGRGGAW
jgi:putative glycosyltransferase (TIGR04348 family)